MKKLILLNENTDIKLNDTGTIIQFKAQNDGQPVSISNGQTATFRIKNDFGFLKSVQANTTYGGYVFELDTEDLKGLVPDTYQVELLVQVDSDNALIFPDKGFVQFSINANALNITGEQLPVMSLEDFKDELKTYVTNQTTAATTSIKNDFDTYVDNLTDSTITTATKASQDATNAINATKSINTGISLDRAKSYALVNTSSNLIVNSDMLVESEGTNPTTVWQGAYGWYYTDGTNPARTNTGNSIKLHKLNSSNSLFSTGVCAGNSGTNTIYSARLYYNNDTTVPVGSTVISIYLEYAYQPDFNNSQKILIGTVDSNSATSGYIEKDNMTVPTNYNWVRMRIESNSDTGFFIWIKLPMLNKGTTALSYESSNNAGQRVSNIESNQSTLLTQVATAQSTADTANNKATANASLIATLNTQMTNYTGATSLPLDCDFNNMPKGIYSLNGWGGFSNYANVPSFMTSNAWYLVANLYNNYANYQIIAKDVGDVYFRVIKPDGTVKSDWKKFAFNTI